MTIPNLDIAPRRVIAPDGNLVEPLEHVLYSTVGLASGQIPQDLSLFNYGIGDPISGAGNLVTAETAKEWHTNLPKGGILPQPQTFLATALRFHMLPITFTTAASGATPALADPGFSAAALLDSNNIEDMRILFESMHCTFKIGQKTYVDEPLFNLPGNTGIGGISAVSIGAAAGTHHLDVALPRWEGVERSFLPYMIRIPSQQSFSVNLACRWTTPPSLNSHRALVAMLDGKIAREVM